MILYSKFKYLKIKLNVLVCTFLSYYIFKYFLGVKFSSKSVIFNGFPIVRKRKKSQIYIGNNCMFISEADGLNLIGINRKCILTTQAEGANIKIGNNCGFSGTSISAFISVTIEDNVKCGANTFITDSDWHPEDPRGGSCGPVIIHKNVWLGLNVVVLKGVSIGENSIIGANSVVTKSIPSNVVAAGNPCKILKKIN